MTDHHKDKTIPVMGATGRQGGSTASHLLADSWRVRALTRDTTGAAAQALEQAGAELVSGDMDDRPPLEVAMGGAYGVFSVQPAGDRELGQGKNVIDVAAAAGVRHLVYSSVGGAEGMSRFLRHEEKWEIENHLRATGMPATILRPASWRASPAVASAWTQAGSRYRSASKSPCN